MRDGASNDRCFALIPLALVFAKLYSSLEFIRRETPETGTGGDEHRLEEASLDVSDVLPNAMDEKETETFTASTAVEYERPAES